EGAQQEHVLERAQPQLQARVSLTLLLQIMTAHRRSPLRNRAPRPMFRRTAPMPSISCPVPARRGAAACIFSAPVLYSVLYCTGIVQDGPGLKPWRLLGRPRNG